MIHTPLKHELTMTNARSIPPITTATLLLTGCFAFAVPGAQLLFDNSDFEKGTLENWTAECDAFTNQPTKGDNPAKRGRPDYSKHQGDFWIGTFEDYNGTSGHPGQHQGDEPTGRLTSVGFEIEQPYLNFLVGGGPNERTSVRLRVGDKTYLLSPGFASETMQPVSADVRAFKGKTARIILLDDETGGWGHINADHFTASAEPLAKVVEPREIKPAILDKKRQVAEFTIDKKYIVYPIENGDGNQSVSLRVDDEVVRFYKTNLASTADDIDWWAFEDVSEFKGRKLTLTVSRHSDEGFKLIRQSDTVPGSDQWGDEPLRPQFHFSQKVGWNNDPNGMVYHDGEWHLYFQHNPVGWGWGNMTWGHAVSKDLVNHGRMIITAPYQNDLDITSVEAFAEGGEARLLSLEVHELNARWK